jgi:YgiT-type zinc finger domain-containing protein
MNCLICRQSELVDDLASITFQRDEFTLVINNVRAQVCPNCGETVMDEETAIQLLSMTEDILHEGIYESVREYAPARV